MNILSFINVWRPTEKNIPFNSLLFPLIKQTLLKTLKWKEIHLPGQYRCLVQTHAASCPHFHLFKGIRIAPIPILIILYYSLIACYFFFPMNKGFNEHSLFNKQLKIAYYFVYVCV